MTVFNTQVLRGRAGRRALLCRPSALRYRGLCAHSARRRHMHLHWHRSPVGSSRQVRYSGSYSGDSVRVRVASGSPNRNPDLNSNLNPNPFSSAWRSSGVSAPPRRPAPSSPSVSRWTSYRGCSPASRCERFTWSTSTAGREWASLSAREYERQRRKRGQPIRSLDTMCTVLLHTLLWSLSLFVGT